MVTKFIKSFAFVGLLFFSYVSWAQPVFTIQNVKGSCEGFANGSLEVLVSSGSSPISIFFFGPVSGGPILASVGVPVTITGLTGSAVSYLIVAQDINGQNNTSIVLSSYPTVLTATVDSVVPNSDCNVPNGAISITPAGGSGAPNYVFSWTGPNGFTSTSEDLTALLGGSYNVTISDLNTNCTEVLPPIVVANPSPASFNVTSPDPSICSGTDLTLNLSGSEVGATYEVFRNNVIATGITAPGTGSPLTFTVPFGTFANGDNFKIHAINGACEDDMVGVIPVTIIPLPTISGLTMPSVCQGSTSANLAYTSTTGTPNQYSIDYDVTAQGQGFVDVPASALPATPIVLVVPGAATPGIYNATLTVINSVTGCPSTATPITATIIANPTITLGPNPSVCIGSPTASLTYSATTGTPNQYSIDFNAGAEAQGFVDVVNAALPVSPISITIPGIAIAGIYNATMTVRNSATLCVSPAQPITVTINPNPTITLGPNPSVCSGLLTTNLTYSATTGGPDQYSLDFNGAAQAQGFVDVVNAPLTATPIAVAVPGAAAPGVYNATIFVRNSLTGCISPPQNITITVVAGPTITLGPNPAVCLGSTTANLPYTGTTGGANQYSIDFDVTAQGQGFVDIVNVVLPASPIVINIPGAAIAGTYNAQLSVLNTVTGCTSAPQAITVTINPTPTITLGANPSVCFGTTTTNLTYSATTGTPNQYSIDFSVAAEGQGFVDVVNAALPASPIAITVPGAAAAAIYTANLTIRNSVTGCVSATSAITVTVVALPTMTLGANPSVCAGSTVANLPYTGTTGTPNQYSINFNAAAEGQGFVDVVNAALPATPVIVAVPPAAAPGVYSATITVLNTTTGCISATQAITVTVIANPTITLGANPSVCLGSTTANLPFTGTTGTPNQFSINFDPAAEGQGFVDVVNAALGASPIVITVPGAAVAGTYNATLTVLNTVSGCISSSQPITVTINPNPTITLGANPAVCSGTTTAPLTYSATTGTPNQFSIDFNAAAEAQGFVDVVNAALPATPISIAVPAGAIAGVYSASITVRNSTTGCLSAALPITVTISLTPTITLGPNPSVCIGASAANLTYTATTGTPNQFSIDFNAAAEAQGFVDVVNAALPASPISITIPGAAVAGIYTASLTVTNTTTTCISAPQPITVTISPLPSITLGPNPSVCIGSATANLGYTGTTGTPNQYSIDFDAAAQVQGFVDVVNAALPATPIVINVPGAAAAGIYNGTITVINTTTGCVSAVQPITVTINLTPTIALGVNPSVCSGVTSAGLPYTGTTGTPNQYSINFNAAAEAQGFVDVTNAALPATPVLITVPAAALPGIYSATITVLNTSTGCISAAQPITVTIQPNPTITLGTNPSVCAGTTSANLPYTATTGTPTQYSINFDATAEAQGFVDVVNAALPATPVVITVPAAALPGIYNATITVLNTTTTCTSASQAITVTVDPIPTITLGPNPTICTGNTSAALAYTATTGSPNQFSIDYNAAAEAQGFVDVVNAALPATPISLTVPAGAVAGLYSASITVSNGTTGCIGVSSPITISIGQTPSIALGPNPSVCAGSTTANLPYTGTTGTPDQYSIDFNGAAQAQGFVDIVNGVLPATPIVITVPGTAVAGVYSGSLFVRNSTSGCLSAPTPITITIVANPTAAISGTTTICSGSQASITINFTGTAPWAFVYSDGATNTPAVSSFPSISFNVLPTVTTTYTLISVTDASVTACPGTVSGSAVVTVNQAPQTNLAVGVTINPLCGGGITGITVANSEAGVSYQLRNDVGDVLVGTPIIGDGTTITLITTPLSANTTFNVLATAPGCTPVELTNTATVTVTGAINAALAVTAQDPSICSGGTTNIQVANSENGVLYQLRNDAGDINIGGPLPGNGGTINLPTQNPLLATTTFNVLATNGSCSIELTDTETVTVSPSPDPSLAVNVTLDPLCVGGSTTITVALSQNGISYQLRNDVGDVSVGSPIIGNGGTIAFPTGALGTTTTFNILATGTGCPAVELTNTATVNVSGNVDATLSVVAAASPICAGTATDIQVLLSESGVTYQLRNDATDANVGLPMAGNGGTILLPTGNLLATTTFNVLATDGTCSIELVDLETVDVDVAPNAGLDVDVTLDPLCVGGVSAVTVTLTQAGVTYQLRNDVGDINVGPAVVSTGGTINLPTGVLNATTVFNILATSGICPAVELTELATVNVAGSLNAGLTVNSSASPICAGTSTFIQVLASENLVSYQLRNDLDDSLIGAALPGNGGTISLPTGNIPINTTFNVVASNGTCSIELTDTETITVTPAPAINLAVTAASTLICSGTSTNIVITGSEAGVSYQLRNNVGNVLVGSPVVSTGGNLLLPVTNLTANTTFNVLATLGGCSAQLTATATVTIRPVGDPACGGGGPSDCTNFSSIVPTIVTQPSCNDLDAGEVSFTISRADATPTTFRVLWTIGSTTQTKFTSNTVSFNDLSSGAYQYTIIDEGNGKACGPVDFFLDLQTQVEILDKQVTANVTCFGGTDGNAILTVDGSSTGEYWYKYVLDGVESSAQTFTPGAPLPGGLPADDNDFIIIKVDESFNFTCPDTVMVRIKHTFSKIDYTVASTEVTTCNGTDGSILVSSIGGGNSASNPLQVRLKKAVPFTTDPSGYIVLIDFEDVVNGVKEYLTLSQGNYVVDVKDDLDCIQSKPIAVQAPGQVSLSSVTVTPSDATCINEGESGSIMVVISDAGLFQVAVSQDQLNVPADDQFVDYSSPGLPSITFSNLRRGAYYLYIKSSTSTCPTRTDAYNIGGFQAIGSFEVLSNCGNPNLTINNITGQVDAPFVIRVFDNDDKFFKIDSLTSSSIPLSRTVTFVYNPPLQHSFLVMPGSYRFVMVQKQTIGTSTCTLVSDTVVFDVSLGLNITMGQVKPSFPEPKRTGSIEIADIDGGTRFLSASNELYYEIALYDADDDIVIEDFKPVKLNPQNKFTKLYEYLPPGVYRIKVRDAAGCEITIDAEITLDPSVFVPNIFTPNDDNVNDTFEVMNLPLTGQHKLIVSNRWGNEVFKSSDYRDGNFWNASDAADGIYFYRLQVDGGETYTGWVEIIRGNKP